MDLTDRGNLIKYLKENGLWAKKSLGQNFLVDNEALDKIVRAGEIKPDDTIIEIGPGMGVLTEKLVENAGEVIAIEKDQKFAEILKLKVKSNPSRPRRAEAEKLKVLERDILDLDIDNIIDCHPDSLVSEEGSKGSISGFPIPTLLKLRGAGKSRMTEMLDSSVKPQNDRVRRNYKVVSNIPYNITSKILEKFLTAENKPELIVLLVQKEVAERICARPGDMSTLSVSVQYFGEPEIIKVVKSSSFFPEPKVDSAILKIRITKGETRGDKGERVNEADLFKIVKTGFHARRKTLVNNLMVGTNLDKIKIIDILKKMGLSETVRAQELSVGQWIKLTEELKD